MYLYISQYVCNFFYLLNPQMVYFHLFASKYILIDTYEPHLMFLTAFSREEYSRFYSKSRCIKPLAQYLFPELSSRPNAMGESLSSNISS